MTDAGHGVARYAMLLNTSGRVEHDLMLYSNDPNDVLIECDRRETKRLAQTLMRCVVGEVTFVECYPAGTRCASMWN